MKPNIYDISLASPCCKLFIRLGRFLSRLIPGKNPSGIFLFFPYWHVGGAEKVHADIVRCVRDCKPWVFFTHRSQDSKFKGMFKGAGRLFNAWIFFKYTLPFSVGFVSGYINRHKRAVVLGCSSRFFYKLLPFLSANVKKIDLMHAFGGGAEDFSAEAIPFLDARVVINLKTKEDFASQYTRLGVPDGYLERIVLIQNSVKVPDSVPDKVHDGPLNVLYVGRGTEEKRVHLVGQAAAICATEGIAAHFTLVGDVTNAVPRGLHQYCTFTGEISDGIKMAELYSAAHLLVLTSSREGFPLVIMEAMAHGVVPVTTGVGGIPEHVVHGTTGFLLHEDEGILPQEIARIIGGLLDRRVMLEMMSRTVHQYSKDNFDSRSFCKKYRELLEC